MSSPDNPFNHWTWFSHWWHTFGRSEGLVRDQLQIHIQRDGSGMVRAIVPLVMTSVGWGRVAVRKVRSFGSAPHSKLTELPQALIEPGWEEASAAAIVGALGEDDAGHHWCELDGVLQGGPMARWFSSRMGEATGWSLRPNDCYYTLALPGSWEELRKTLGPHIKKNLRNSHAALARDGHRWTFESVTEAASLQPALTEFFTLHQARAGSDRGPRHNDHFASTEARTFLRLVADDLAREGRFIVGRLRIGEETVASRIILVSGDCYYLYHAGFDPNWWRYSVGTTLAAECIKLAISRGGRIVNLSTGRDPSKTRWGAQERYVGGVRLVAANASSRLIAAAHDLTRRVIRSSGENGGLAHTRAAIGGILVSLRPDAAAQP